ncbi:MAG: sulfite exporter TauE/SafE family protein [Planktomarina sp.]|nr:sulfite exporter TauE/SafE family protein [Planktomarina sp.]
MIELPVLLPVLLSLVVIGAFAGFLAGLLGVGGGIVLVPSFFYAFQSLGFDGPQLMQVCLATSLATIIVTSLRSMQSHNEKGSVDWELLRNWSPGISIGAICSVLLAANLGSASLQLIFGGLGALVGIYLTLGKQTWYLADHMPEGVLRWALSGILGSLSVLLGIGGGSLGVPLMSLYRIPIHMAVGTASGFGLAIAVPSVITWSFISVDTPGLPFNFGAVNIPAFLLIIPMTFIFTPFGATVAHQMDAKPLKRLFGVFLLIVAVNMMSKALWS